MAVGIITAMASRTDCSRFSNPAARELWTEYRTTVPGPVPVIREGGDGPRSYRRFFEMNLWRVERRCLYGWTGEESDWLLIASTSSRVKRVNLLSAADLGLYRSTACKRV